VRPFFGLFENSCVAIIVQVVWAQYNMRRTTNPERARLIRRKAGSSQLQGVTKVPELKGCRRVSSIGHVDSPLAISPMEGCIPVFGSI
jgi:hypothetical protein